MARKRQSPIEDIMDIAAHLPWKVGVGLAVVVYLVLHYFATRAPMSMNPADLTGVGKTMGDSVVHGIWVMLAGIFQYVLPLALGLGAAVSFFRQGRQQALHAQVAGDASTDALNKMSWREFEGLVAETYRRQGFRVIERGGNGPDGGVDLELYMGRDKYLVQCKQWKSIKVGVASVRELYGVMSAEGAIGGFVVASGSFTADAKAFAEGRSIKLVPATSLRRMIVGASDIGEVLAPVGGGDGGNASVVACPKCGQPMVLRTAKRGKMAGKEFLGCSNYPNCQGTRDK